MDDLINLKTNLIGLLGHPIKHTYSPFIHNLALKLKNLDYYYVPFDINSVNLKGAIKGMISLNFIGFNVTIPYKTKVVPLLNHLSDESAIIGSVNTVVINEGNLFGYNTDVNGVYETLLPFRNELLEQDFSIFGAGGAARAVIYTLIKHFKPRKIYLINRTEDRSLVVKDIFADKMRFNSIEILKFDPSELIDVVQSSKLVVNTTPLGMAPDIDDAIVSSEKFFNNNQIVFDLIYNPQLTKFLEIASKSNAYILNGLDMLIHQAAKSFELWTSENFPFEEVKKSLTEKLISV